VRQHATPPYLSDVDVAPAWSTPNLKRFNDANASPREPNAFIIVSLG